jgi:hypothetical protein
MKECVHTPTRLYSGNRRRTINRTISQNWIPQCDRSKCEPNYAYGIHLDGNWSLLIKPYKFKTTYSGEKYDAILFVQLY